MDLGVGARLLVAELVARNAEDDEVVVVVVKRTQTCVLRREASSTRDVDDERELALVVGEVDLVARDRGHGDVVELSWSEDRSARCGSRPLRRQRDRGGVQERGVQRASVWSGLTRSLARTISFCNDF